MQIEMNELAALISGKVCDDSHWKLGHNYLIRTVTMIQVGRLEKVTEHELVLSRAAWIADTGRFSECLHNGTFKEVEMFQNDAIIGRGAIIDATYFPHQLPINTK